MNELNKFYNKIEKILSDEGEVLHHLSLLRDLVKESLANDHFKLLCINEIISSIESSVQRNLDWNAPHLFYHEKLKFSVRIIFWPAFYDNNPHQHKTWSVTGVFHNFLNIYTYNLIHNPQRLKKEKSIIASSGDVGYLIPGCIHNVRNPSHEVSASFHIFNNIDIQNPEDNAIWYPSPRKFNLSNGIVERALDACLTIMENIKSEKIISLIDRIYKIGSDQLKFKAIHTIYKYDRHHAKQYFEKLERSFN